MKIKTQDLLGKHFFYFNFGKNFAFGFISLIMQATTIVGVYKLRWYMVPAISLVAGATLYVIGWALEVTGIRRGFKNAEYRDTLMIDRRGRNG